MMDIFGHVDHFRAT